MHRLMHLRNLLLALVVATFGASAMLAPTLAQDEESTPTVSDPTVQSCDTEAVAASATSTYTITNGEDSTASYSAEEVLNGEDVTAVGTTNQILGNVYFDADGNPLQCSRFDVDMRTLESDETRRDNYLRENTLESEEFPLATFILDSVTGLDGALEDGQTYTVQLKGDLTLHGESKSVVWDAELTKDGDTITATATVTIQIDDFGMEEPSVPFVASIDDNIVLSVNIVAQVAS